MSIFYVWLIGWAMEKGQPLVKVEEKPIFLFAVAPKWGLCLHGLSLVKWAHGISRQQEERPGGGAQIDLQDQSVSNQSLSLSMISFWHDSGDIQLIFWVQNSIFCLEWFLYSQNKGAGMFKNPWLEVSQTYPSQICVKPSIVLTVMSGFFCLFANYWDNWMV